MLNTNKRSHVNKLYQRLSQKTHIYSKKKQRGKLCMCVCVGGEAPMKMHFMHYFSISDISCFMDLFKSSQVNRKGEEGESRSERYAK